MPTYSLFSPNSSGGYPIWVDKDYYIRVDHEGYVLGTCYEGALGCVIPLFSARDHNRLALKLPRMLADTVRENAFISQVVSAESLVVHRANEEFKAMAGLVPVQALGRSILRGFRELRNASTPEALRQDGCILLVSFRKDRNPRICAVKYEGDKRQFFPPGCDQDLSFFTRRLWEISLKFMHPSESGEDASFYFEVAPREVEQEVAHASLSTTMALSMSSDVWFGALPSILYNWANGTLQEAVSQGRMQTWSMAQHYELCSRVLRGVDTLHSKKFIHGDLRPANIMTCGSASSPEDYVVGDYGSFAEEFPQLGSPQNPGSGHTMVGGLGRHRTSLFYAPERRAGVERETADVAVILSQLDEVNVDDEYLIYFGWRSQVIDQHTHLPRPGLLAALRADWRRMRDAQRNDEHASVFGDRLTRGDRLRVREFIFTIIDAEEFDDAEAPVGASERNERGPAAAVVPPRRLVFRCHRRYSNVLHERLTVYDNGPGIEDGKIVGLPNFVELRQWSVASDLYGAGALILYTVFMSGLRESLAGTTLGSRAREQSDTMADAETLLAQILEVLEGIPSFLALWSDLEDFRWNLEHPDHAEFSGTDLARVELRQRPHGVPQEGGANLNYSAEEPGERRTVGGFALRTVNNLLRSVPNIRHILHMFRCTEGAKSDPARSQSTYNAAHFLLFVHFVMACLHRRSHLRAVGETELDFPFCRDRCDSPGPNGPAARALGRIEALKRCLLQPRYESIVVHDKQLVNFDPRDVMQIRIEHAQFGRELVSRRKEVQDLSARLQAAMARNIELERELSSHTERNESMLRGADTARQRAVDEANTQRKEMAVLQSEVAASRAENKELRENSDRLRAEKHQAWRSLATTERSLETAGERAEKLQRDLQALTSEHALLDDKARGLASRIKELEARSERRDSESREVLKGVKESMVACLAELDEIDRSAWRIPRGRMDRVVKILTIWREWGEGGLAETPGP